MGAQQTPTWTTGTYAYDGSGNIAAIGSDQYHYDSFGRLTSGTAGPGHTSSYTYDRFGNMLSMKIDGTTVTYGVDRTTNRMSSLTDANGNPANYGTYDPAGRMTALADGSQLEYDSLGMVRKSSGTPDGQTKIYIYTPNDERIGSMVIAGDNEVSSEWTLRDASGKVLRRVDKSSDGAGGWTWSWRQDYIYRDNDLLASEIDTAPYTLHYFSDHLGSPRLVTGNGGMKIASHTYFPFGTEAPPVASQSTGSYASYDRLKFTGHERDASGLDYMHARYYGAGVGRFLSPDPVLGNRRNPQSWNRYTYARNNPVNRTDPDGREDKATPCEGTADGKPCGSESSPHDSDANSETPQTEGTKTTPGEKLNFLPHDDPNQTAAKWNSVPDNTILINSHGGPATVNHMDAGKLADRIKEESKTWRPGVTIILNSCNSARGENSIAQQLSRVLRTTVIGSDQPVWSFGPFDLGSWGTYGAKGGMKTGGRPDFTRRGNQVTFVNGVRQKQNEDE